MAQKINETRNVIVEKQDLLDSANEELAIKGGSLTRTREYREALEAQVSEHDMERLKQKLEKLKVEQEEKQAELDFLHNEVHLTEATVRDENAKKIDAEKDLIEIQNEVADVMDKNAILEQRIENEKNIAHQMILSKFAKHEQQIHRANVNLAVELRSQMEEKAVNEGKLEELGLMQSNVIKDIEALKDAMTQKKAAKDEMAEQIVKVSERNQTLQEAKNVLLRTFIDVKKMKADAKEEADKSASGYEKKIKKQKRKQTLFGVDDDNSSKKSSDEVDSSLSQISSSLLDTDVGPLEKIDLETSVDTKN